MTGVAAQIAAEVRRRHPSVAVVHLGGEPPLYAGTWYFRFDRLEGEIVMSSPTGDFPFFIRASEDEPGEACPVDTLDEAALVLGKYLDELRGIDTGCTPSRTIDASPVELDG